MNRTRSPRLRIGVLLLSLMLAPLFVAPATAQEVDTVHYIDELHDGVGIEDPLELAQGFDTWWMRHNSDYQSGTYGIVEEPFAPGSSASLHLGIDSDAGDAETTDQARVMAYIELGELDPENPPELPDASEFFDQGLAYTMFVQEGSDVGSATQLAVEVFYGLDPVEVEPRFTTLQLMPDRNTDVEDADLTAGAWQTFEWTADTVTYSSVDGSFESLGEQLDKLYAQAEADGEFALSPSAIGFGLNLGSEPGAAVDTYIDNVVVGDDAFKFGEDPRPTLTEWPETAYPGDTVTVQGTNLTDATVELNGAGEVEATINEDGTELSFVVPEDAALGVRPVVITTPYGEVRFNLEILERTGDQPHPGFTDVPETHLFFGEITWLANQDITRGCNPPANDMFCPDDSITRGQMAAFLNRALDWPASDVDGFEDDGHSVFEGDLNAAKAQDVFRGCNPPLNTLSCVDDPITRGEMAAVVVRALDLPASNEDAFVDDDLSVFEGDINALAAADVTRGCNPPANDEFCPDREMTRGEMAAFLFRALADRLNGEEEAMES